MSFRELMRCMRPRGLIHRAGLPFLAVWFVFAAADLRALETLWTFSNATNRLLAASGPGTLVYYDPNRIGWGQKETVFGKASELGLPAISGGDPTVMLFPACTAARGYRLVHGAPPNGSYGESHGRISNYTLVMDVLFPAESDGRFRALYQTDTNNTSDAEFYVQNTFGGGIGTLDIYNGTIRPNTWHRIAIVMQSAPGEGKCQRFIDGQFVGGIGSTGSGLDLRWALDRAFLLFTENDGETAPGCVSSIYFVDRALRMNEVEALGGPNAAGANVPGAPAPLLEQRMSRRVRVVGHRGGFFCCAPDNTLAAVRYALTNEVPIIEIDLRLSADGVSVLMHDATVDRTTDGSGNVASMTVAQLKQLDAGSWFSSEFAGERIPTLAEVMTEARDRMILYFDLKVPGQIAAISEALTETGFNTDDCWFWVANNAGDAASIRAALPAARIVWEPPVNWASDVTFFDTMRSMGVYAFDLGVYYGTVNRSFVRAAKEQGFVVGVYTILDPDAMVRNAAEGVDFMETDFPQVMNQLQPLQTSAATPTSPANGTSEVLLNPLLTWVAASNATTYRVYVGTNSSPPLLREQSADVVWLSNLVAGATYYWRVDAVTESAEETGPVWSFTTTANTGVPYNVYEWTFDMGNVSATVGAGSMGYADGLTLDYTTFQVTDGANVPHIGGTPATYMRVPPFQQLNNGYHLTFARSAPNGGGAYLNRYTLIVDVFVPGTLDWTPLFNTNPDNGNDADWFIAPGGRVGIGELGYSPVGTVRSNTWYRLAFVADLAAGVVSYYRNGTNVFQRVGGALRDGRFSLFSNNDPGPDLLLFNEGDASGVYTHEVYVASVAFVDRPLTGTEILALGAPTAQGIFINGLHLSYSGDGVTLNWLGKPNTRLQRSASLMNGTWRDVPDTVGASAFFEGAVPSGMFYRLFTP